MFKSGGNFFYFLRHLEKFNEMLNLIWFAKKIFLKSVISAFIRIYMKISFGCACEINYISKKIP